MNRMFSANMSVVNDKIDVKFEALEKRIEEFIKSETMTFGITEDLAAQNADLRLQKKLGTLASEISKLKENGHMFDLQMKDHSCRLKKEYNQISAEIKSVQEKGDVFDVEATLNSLESCKQENIVLQKNAILCRQAQWKKIDSDIERLRCELEHVDPLFVAHDSAYTNCLNLFTQKMDLLNRNTLILKQKVDTIRRMVDLEEEDAHQLVLDINLMSERIENAKKQIEDYTKDIESDKKEEKRDEMMETKVLEMLEKMNSRISTDMENLNNKLDAKFNAFEKKIEELIKFEDMTDDTVDASTAHDVDLLKTLESCEVSGFKDHIQWLVRMHNNGFGYEVENSEISAEIEHLKLGHDDGLSRTEQISVLKREIQANIEFQRKIIAFLQCDLKAMDGNIKHLEDILRNLSVAHKSPYTLFEGI
ncbi:hypothetical protein J5N97_017922 [Dioscorea zingiberensis]|uniref:Uncharacterized protein n=1 Tax=Dioscorea zingiberensis TaxID=325984 RepID=A0A9D5CP92_9LILI|nr:hypothetical protein J5N97_017922 [Dioscorea zingiberensis]